MKITQADTPTIRMDCHPILTNWCPHLCHPTIVTPDTLPGATLPIYPGLGQAPNMLACIPGGLVVENRKKSNWVSDGSKSLVVQWQPLCCNITLENAQKGVCFQGVSRTYKDLLGPKNVILKFKDFPGLPSSVPTMSAFHFH